MSEDTKKPNEFRRYRQVLTTVYLTVAGLGFALLVVSVVRSLFHTPPVELRGPKLSADDPSAASLVDCNRDVRQLLVDMAGVSSELVAAPVNSDGDVDLGARWEEYSRQWRRDWDEVNARCRFSELAGTRMGLAYDRMAGVHGDLPAMRLKYQGLLVDFDEEQADELERMRRALDLSLAALEKRAQGADR